MAKFNLAKILAIVFIILICVILSFLNLTTETRKPVNVALIHGGIPQSLKFNALRYLTGYSRIKLLIELFFHVSKTYLSTFAWILS